MSNHVKIFDTTLRDGEQSPGATMNTAEKIRIAAQLDHMGVDIIEAGFPIASPGDLEAVSAIAAEIKKSTVAGLARCNTADIDAAWQAVSPAVNPRIHVFIATSPIHMAHKLKLEPDQVIESIHEGVTRARKLCADIEFSAEDASRSEPEFLVKAFETAIDAGATTINVPDTVGYTLPEEFGNLIAYLKSNIRNIDKAVISVHCHNDLGLAVANTLAAVKAGARQVESTINGIGERAGNASVEEVVMALHTRKDMLPYTTAVDTTQLYPASRLVSLITGMPVQPNKAIVGANAFAHESGIHQDGMLKNRQTYEIMQPETIGLNASNLVLGKHSGRHAFKDRLSDMGYRLGDDEIGRLFKRFKALADAKKEVFNEDIEALIADEMFHLPDTYELEYLNVMCGTQVQAVATVGLKIEGQPVKRAGFGVGPVDAVFSTIKNMVGSRAELVRYTVGAITGGMDAQGEVTVRLKENGYLVLGRAADQDILTASAKALVNGLNRLEQMKKNPLRNGPHL